MAIARVTLKCTTCGKEFTMEKHCMNRKQADNWEEYMQDAERECPECYKARRAAERAEAVEKFSAEFDLPEITGVSEKQIKYANDLRAKCISRLVDDYSRGIDGIKADMEAFKECIRDGRFDAQYSKNEKSFGKDDNGAATETLTAIVDERKPMVAFAARFVEVVCLLGVSNAHDIIEMLAGLESGRPYRSAALKTVVAKIKEEIAAEEAAKAAAAIEEDNDNNATEETTEEATTTETKKPSYDKSAIMRSAWAKYKAKGNKKTFGECLKAAWAEAKKAAGVETTAAKRTTTEKTAKTTRRTSKTSTAVYAG